MRKHLRQTGPVLGLVIALVLVLDGTGVAARFPSIDIGEPAVEVSDRAIESVRYDDGLVPVASYLVDGGELVISSGSAPTLTHRRLWALVDDVLPERYLTQIRQFSVVREHPYDVVAVVHQSVRHEGRWILTIDEADAENRRVLVDTIVHELAHLVTLDASTFAFDVDASRACDGVRIPLGCASDGSLMAAWTERFWSDPYETPEYDDDRFVTAYAASSPHEDLAESFMVWVRDGSSDDPTVRGAKLRFFDEVPELVVLRAQLGDGRQ